MNFSFSRYSDLLCLGLVPLKFELTQSAFKLKREKLYCHDVREHNILSLSRTGNPGAKLYPLNVIKASLLCPVVTKRVPLILFSNVLKNSACLKTLGSHELTLHTAATCGTQIHPVLAKQRDKTVFFV